MTCLSIESSLPSNTPDKSDVIRAAVFWGFILLVIVSPAVLSAVILLRP